MGMSPRLLKLVSSSVPTWLRQVFVDSVNGSDANNGLSAGAAKQTLAGAAAILIAYDNLTMMRGSYWRERFDVPVSNLWLSSGGAGDIPVIDGADIVTTGWTQPDAGTYPNVWSRAWSRGTATTTASEFTGYWEAGVRTTRQTSLALLQAGANGDWHTTGITLKDSTISIKSAADPNSDGILREITKRAYGINSHRTTNGASPNNTTVEGLIEIKRCYGHYNALSQGRGTASRLLLRDGTAHHSVSEGHLTDIVMAEQSPDGPAACVASYTGTPAGFNPVNTRCLALFPGGLNRINNASAYYAHGTSTIDSLTLNQCISKGADFANHDALLMTIYGGYCEDYPGRAIALGGAFSLNNIISYFVARETTASPFSASNNCFFTGGTAPVAATITHSYGIPLTGGCVTQSNTTLKHYHSHCAYFSTARIPYAGGGPDIRYTVCHGARSYNTFLTSYTGDYNVFYFSGQPNPQFNYNGSTYGTLADFQTASGQDANSVFLKATDQGAGNANAFWLGIATNANAGPPDGDWRINPSARVYNGAGATLTGLFADGVTLITMAGPQGYWDFNARAVVSGPLTRYPTLPATIAEMRTYIEDPEAWDFYP